MYFRVPTMDESVFDLNVMLEKSATYNEIKADRKYTQTRQRKSYNLSRLEKAKLTPKGNKTCARNSAPSRLEKVKLTPTGNKTCGRISGSMVPSKPTLLVAAQKKNVAKLSPKVLTSVSQKEGDEIYRTKHFASGDGAATAVITNPLRLLSVFSKAATDDVPIEISDYLSCKNILDIFHGPVITPSGLAYERVVILDYLEKHLKTRRAVDMSRKRFEKQRELIERLRRSEKNSRGNGSKSSDYI
ncbi:E3 ubiquitin protein ligase CHIP [Tanacetum coccineum]